MQLLDKVAARVGTTSCPLESPAGQIVSQKLAHLEILSIFVCRGTEKFQVPLQAPDPKVAPLRYSVGMHRATQEITDFGSEDWGQLSRSQRVRNCMSCKLLMTVFARHRGQSDVSTSAAPPSADHIAESEQEAASPLRPSDLSRDRHRQVEPSDLCERWGPPPVPLHGPKFRGLDASLKQELVQVHKELGRPDPQKLASHLRARQALPEVTEAALNYVCDTCVETAKTRHQRPGKLHDPMEFNQMVGLDGFYWSGKAGFQVHVFHCIDEASLFHIGRRIEHRDSRRTIQTWQDMWTSRAGMPQSTYVDPAGEFVSHEWISFVQGHNVTSFVTDAPWQKGRVERHGQIMKDMLHRFDHDHVIRDVAEFDSVLRTCFQAKNALVRHEGYCPEQLVLGRSTPLPASLSSDDRAVAHGLAEGSSLASETFRNHLERRALARKAFVLSDNDAAIRRALHRRSCPTRGPSTPGQMVMFSHKKAPANRLEAGRWCGPATVMSQVGQSTVWLSFHDRVFRCPPESLRPASLREWNGRGSVSEFVQNEHDMMSSRPEQRVSEAAPEPVAIETVVSQRTVPQEPFSDLSTTVRQVCQPESEIPPDRTREVSEVPLESHEEQSSPPSAIPVDLEVETPSDDMHEEANTLWCNEIVDDSRIRL